MIKAGIIGGAGYTAGELIRILVNHPEVKIEFINSTSNAGKAVADVHGGLTGETELVFTNELPLDGVDVLFLCSANGDSRRQDRQTRRGFQSFGDYPTLALRFWFWISLSFMPILLLPSPQLHPGG